MELEKTQETQFTGLSSTTAALASTAPQLSSVQDLERRLKLIGDAPKAATVPVMTPAVAPAAPAVASMSGKTALLARIQAAKAKSNMVLGDQKPAAVVPPPPAPEVDLLSGFDAPSHVNDPPPQYDTNFLPPPPAFDATVAAAPPPPVFDPLQFAPPPPLNNTVLSPPPMHHQSLSISPPAASAPAFEDLMFLQHQSQQQQQQQLPEQANFLDMPLAMPPPPEIDEDILAALDPSERAAILEEQRKIMEEIESTKHTESTSSAAARAMAFNQRSGAAVARIAGQYDSAPPIRSTTSSTISGQRKMPPPAQSSSVASRPGMVDLGAGEMVPLHGQEKTQAAIRDGTARIVQCLNCQNWMQVTNDATLMFCPTCQVVSPVLLDETATAEDLEEAAQMAADAQLAEKLQAEEYGAMERARSTSAAGATTASTKKTAKLEKGQAVEKSWYDWFMGSNPESQPGTQQAPPPARGSAELPTSRGLVAASTGHEAYGRGGGDESERLMGTGGGGGGARMAESKGMFACVADAVGTAVFAMNTDEEGNVHGVDSSGLLAMPNVSRQRD